jgi:transcriptional regulator with XRE-family HTH domain
MAKVAADDQRLSVRQLVGERLKAAREALGLSQRAVADALGLTSLSVIHYEAGRTPFPTDLLPVLKELGIDGDWVASGVPSLEHRETRERFSAVLAWVRREVAIHELVLTPTQETDISWYVFRQLDPRLASQLAPTESDLAVAVKNALAKFVGAAQ